MDYPIGHSVSVFVPYGDKTKTFFSSQNLIVSVLYNSLRFLIRILLHIEALL